MLSPLARYRTTPAEPQSSSSQGVAPPPNLLFRTAQVIGNLIPNAMTMAILPIVVLAIAALPFGNPPLQVMDVHYEGFWMLLPFTMQTTLILVHDSTLASTRFFGRLIHTLSNVPRSEGHTIALSMATTCCLAFWFWGLSLALAPLVAVSNARRSAL